ncbi:uncharacterized protein E5676_scaffold220G00140 [Cucumis melo var. makuwa]|uniref:Reverse transcriptase domain-containing protein n=1 Tax=Cucumis melo var. makuwa TaxID=1194695 RepID=A0A5D3BC69_CUCMM|nr:uncharacterized protein E5676_scaffold220G00140 [Cucumis melo var. makuwa]
MIVRLVALTQATNDVFKNRMLEKMIDLGSFMVPCLIRIMDLGHAMCDLKASINLMPLSIFKKLKIGEIQPTHMRLQFINRSIAKSEDKIEDVLVKGWPFLSTGHALIDVHQGELTMCFNDEEVKFNVVNTMKFPTDEENCSAIEQEEDKAINRGTTGVKLKPLLNHLKYAYLGENDTLPVMISTHLDVAEEKTILNMLKRHKKAIEWTLVTIQGISPSYCMHKIRLEKDQEGTISSKGD